jgi:heat shock protein HslJ
MGVLIRWAMVGLMLMLASAASAQESDDLAGLSWRLVSIDGEGIPDSVTVTLIFETNGRAGGTGGCNNYGAVYSVDGSSITFAEIVSTLMACVDEVNQIESAYFAALQTAIRYTLDTDRLVIVYGDDQQLVFEPLALLAGSEWQLVELQGEAVAGEITLTFGEDGAISGSGGCNTYGGSYTVGDGRLTLSQLYSTEMACLEENLMAQEMAYLQALQSAASYEMTTEDQLVVTLMQGESLIFDRLIRLENTQWQLITYGDTMVLEDTDLTLEFRADGELGGSSGCNTFGSTYTLAGSTIRIAELISTRMACLDDASAAQEQAYLEALASAASISLRGDELVMTYGPDQALVFVRIASLAGTAWQLISLDGQEAPVEDPITLIFAEDAQITGSGGCNPYGGSYRVEGDTLTFSELVTTRIACMENGVMERETQFFAALNAAVGYELREGRLVIVYGDGQELIFAAAEPETTTSSSSG